VITAGCDLIGKGFLEFLGDTGDVFALTVGDVAPGEGIDVALSWLWSDDFPLRP
jgi:hypothetical protein